MTHTDGTHAPEHGLVAEPPADTSRRQQTGTDSSNRVHITPRTATDDLHHLHEVIRVDKVKLGFPIDTPSNAFFDQRHTDFFAKGSRRRTGTRKFTVDGMAVFMYVAKVTEQWMAYVVFNPAKHAINLDPWKGLPISDLVGVHRAVWWELHNYVCPKVALEEVGLRRLDLCRDHTMSSSAMNAVMTAASKVKVPYATKRTMYVSGNGTLESVYTGTKRQGCVRGYDHHACHGTSPKGTFRVEVQAHTKWMDRYGDMTTVADLSPTSITDLYLNRFEWSGFGTPAIHEHTRTEQMWEMATGTNATITPMQVTRLLGRERLLDAGIDPGEGTSTASLRRALTARLGVPHRDPDCPQVIRLDPRYDRPVEVAAC